MRAWLACLTALTLVAPASAQADPHAFVGGLLLPVAGAPIEDGVLLVHEGRILAVGRRDAVALPAGTVVIDVSGKTLFPGLVCTHSHVGDPWGADDSDPIQPEVRNADAINVRTADIQRAQAGGITTANVMPGSGHLISGQTTYLKLRDGRTLDELAYHFEDGAIMGGLKMANGTNSQRDPPFPGTRSKSAALVRQEYVKAQEYQAALARAASGEGKAPDRDLGLETLVEVLEGRRVVHHHTHRHDDIATVLRLQREFGFRLVLQHVSEAYKLAPEIAAAGVPCSLILIDSPGGKIEAADMSWETGAVLEAAGVPVAYHTDDWVNDSRLFVRSAALAQRAGLSRQAALESVTLAGARMLDLGERIGSLEVGKDADFVVLSGDPLSVYTMVEQTWVDGSKVFDLSDPHDQLYAFGGEGASHGMTQAVHCCLEETR